MPLAAPSRRRRSAAFGSVRPAMRAGVAIWVGLAATLLATSVQAQDAAPTGQLAQMQTPDERILPPGGGAAASALAVEARCDPVRPGQREAVFIWTPVGAEQARQRVDISMFRDGFDTGRFETLAVLPAAQSSLIWTGGEPGIRYFWRVLTLSPRGWIASDNARYTPPTCPVDFQREPGAPQ